MFSLEQKARIMITTLKLQRADLFNSDPATIPPEKIIEVTYCLGYLDALYAVIGEVRPMTPYELAARRSLDAQKGAAYVVN